LGDVISIAYSLLLNKLKPALLYYFRKAKIVEVTTMLP